MRGAVSIQARVSSLCEEQIVCGADGAGMQFCSDRAENTVLLPQSARQLSQPADIVPNITDTFLVHAFNIYHLADRNRIFHQFELFGIFLTLVDDPDGKLSFGPTAFGTSSTSGVSRAGQLSALSRTVRLSPAGSPSACSPIEVEQIFLTGFRTALVHCYIAEHIFPVLAVKAAAYFDPTAHLDLFMPRTLAVSLHERGQPMNCRSQRQDVRS